MTNTEVAILRWSQHDFRLLIDGRLVGGEMALQVINPATEKVFVSAPAASKEQLDLAVAAARAAAWGWSRVPVETRRALVRKLADALREISEPLAELVSLEQGKTIGAARMEMVRAADSMDEIAAIDIDDELLRDDHRGRVEVRYKPLGVIGAITPWNVPIALAAPKIASAIYTGNAVVLKPSPFTPLATLLMGEAFAPIVPHGLLAILSGHDDLGPWMTEHPGIDKINFTGSIATGKRIMQSAARSLKRLTLELGGNDPAIVLDDADPAAIAPRIFAGAFGLSGQVCMAIKRLYVHRSLYEPMVAELTRLARNAKLGDGLEDDVEFGPLQNRIQFERVLELIEEARAIPGARITAGGHALNRPGYFIAPTIIADVAEGNRIVDEEPFGPILPILVYDDVDEAVRRANATRFGLGASVWTSRPARGAEIAARLESGIAWVNHHVGTTRDMPFGGVKESGIGRQGHSIGVRSDMESQVIVLPAGVPA